MRLLRKAYYLLRPGQRRIARRLFYLPTDTLDTLLSRRPPLVPPKGKIFTGQGDFVTAGSDLLANIKNSCGLQPHHHVLDIGCGIGRMARPLTGFLSGKGKYEGFDVVSDGIDWCKNAYVKHQNFRFLHIPLQNDLYNLDTPAKAEHFTFPYDDGAFDLVMLISVFTHMQPGEVKRYIAEIARVLKPGRFCFATFFLITPHSEAYLSASPEPFFPHRDGDFFLHDSHVRNANIAYRMSFVSEALAVNNLSIIKHHEGWWAGKTKDACMNFQDVLVIRKPA